MKFSTKVVLGTWIIIALSFSLGGTYMIQKNFRTAFNDVAENHQRQHILNRYSLESDVRNGVESADSFSTEMIKKYAKRIVNYGQSDIDMIVTEITNKAEGEVIFKNINKIDNTMQQYIENGKTDQYKVYEKDGKHYMLIASVLNFYGEHRIKIINRYDISSTFNERDRQVKDFIRLDLVIMIAAFVFIIVLTYFLTRNIKKLSVISSRISKGEYGIRTNIHSGDEIGELSRNFDAMAASIEEHICRLEEDIEVREQFVSDFSHELKTPMTSMMGYSQLLLGDSLDDNKKKKAVNYIYSECDRLRKLSNTLLKMLGIVEENIDKKWVYTKWIGLQTERICSEEMKKSELTVDIENALINTDADLVITLLKNLINNGDKASENKDIDRVIVQGRADNESGKYIITVKDTGCGMESSEIDKIVQPFYMIDKSRARSEGGSGIGLAICNRICQFLEIDMKIKSQIGNGTTVTLIFKKSRMEEENV